MKKYLLSFSTVAALSAFGADTVLYNNLSATQGAGNDGISTGGNGPLYQSFSTGSSVTTLTGLQLLLGNGGTGTSDSISIGLYSDSSSPSTIPPQLIASIGSILDSTVTSSTGDTYTVSLTSNPTLSANTRYWIGLSEPTTGGAFWNNSTDTTPTGVAGGFYYNQGGYQANAGGAYQAKITVSSVPEPTQTALVAGVLCLGVGALLRQRRQA